jgi:hypothetical protein
MKRKLNHLPGPAIHTIVYGALALWFIFTANLRADSTWAYAVQINAEIQASPPQITLHWLPDSYGAKDYVISRKLKEETSWGPQTWLPGSATNFTDTNVSEGTVYEYRIIKHATLGYTGYGYICSAINGALIENRGKLILIVAADTRSLASELTRLQSDLTGDGWFVIRHDVSDNASLASVKNLIVQDYNADSNSVRAVFLFGHVPVDSSGDLNYDSHGARPMPADAFYADMDGDWQLDLNPTNRPSYMPSNIELMVGRVDFSNMPGNGAPAAWPSETELLRRYLNKDHDWRHKLLTAPRRALLANRVGDFDGQAYAASGYRNFQPFVGPGNIVEADVSDGGPPEQRWITLASREPWLWSYACAPAQDSTISQLGTRGLYHDLWSIDIVAQDARVVFSMFLGSHFGDWTRPDDIMRSMLATPTMGLTACLVGLPHWFCHHMAMGEPIGYSVHLTMNNTSLYQNQSNALPRGVLINLMGDPTLRMEMVAPPSGLQAVEKAGRITLNWSESPEPVLGYHVYRSPSLQGPFNQLTKTIITGSRFTDTEPMSGFRTYMVRAIGLQTNPSGSYLNPSQGIFVNAGGGPAPGPVTVAAALRPEGLQLTWDSAPGFVYHVEAKAVMGINHWRDISGPITAMSDSISFVDENWLAYTTRFYRVVGE